MVVPLVCGMPGSLGGLLLSVLLYLVVVVVVSYLLRVLENSWLRSPMVEVGLF